MVGLERTILIEGAGQIAAPSWHGYAAESIVHSTHSHLRDSRPRRHRLRRPAGMATISRYVLPKDLDEAIRHLDDQQLDRLVGTYFDLRREPVLPTQRRINVVGDDAGPLPLRWPLANAAGHRAAPPSCVFASATISGLSIEFGLVTPVGHE
jgi:hypothetical protein